VSDVQDPGEAPIVEISREEVARRLRDPSLKIVNVLPRTAFLAARIPGSLCLPVAEIPSRAAELLRDRDAEIAVYCAAFT
jgi:rhodanese-related sulfurtransferase